MYDEATDVINLIDFGAARDYPVQFVDNYLKMVSLIDDVLNSSFSVCSLSQIVPHRTNSCVSEQGGIYIYPGHNSLQMVQSSKHQNMNGITLIMLSAQVTSSHPSTHFGHNQNVDHALNCKVEFVNLEDDATSPTSHCAGL